MHQMQQHSTRMENIVRNLLILSSLETEGIINTQDVIDLKSLFSEIQSDTQQMFKDKAQAFELVCPLPCASLANGVNCTVQFPIWS